MKECQGWDGSLPLTQSLQVFPSHILPTVTSCISRTHPNVCLLQLHRHKCNICIYTACTGSSPAAGLGSLHSHSPLLVACLQLLALLQGRLCVSVQHAEEQGSCLGTGPGGDKGVQIMMVIQALIAHSKKAGKWKEDQQPDPTAPTSPMHTEEHVCMRSSC